jgi:hybrid cluster-associated redox disulfide protein
MMELQQVSQGWTVSEVLQMYPGSRQVFIARMTMCLGCHMARFCTLKDVAQIYGMETETLVHEIQKAVFHNNNQDSKE